jgi:iron complex outermembrane receptor protein
MKKMLRKVFTKMTIAMLFVFFTLTVSAQTISVKGTVISSDKLPLPGATVMVKGTKNGSNTDMNGNFVLSAKKDDKLTISSIGFETQEVVVTGNAITIQLKSATNELKDVVVTAMGIKRESKKLGYAVSKVSGEDIVKTGATNFAGALYGKASGVRIQSAPGGSTSAVSINIRGVSSITGSNQPLIVVDGVIIRGGALGSSNGDANTGDYWKDQRVQGNGLLDINPEDIGDLTILKGSAASALYGSQGANGVVVITTKSGKNQKGLGIDFNVTTSLDQVAYMPEYQTTFGPGGGHESTSSYSYYKKGGDGFKATNYNGKTYDALQYDTSRNFGPRFDGREVLYWDGSVRNYSPSQNQWNELFQVGVTQNYSLAITQTTDKNNLRFSYTGAINEGVQKESKNNKHNFNLIASSTLSPKIKIDYTANYIAQSITNRPYRISRITNNFGGMFSTFDDTKLMYDKTVTSAGFLNVGPTGETVTPDESFFTDPAAYGLMKEYFWRIRKIREEETMNRLLASVTPTINFTDNLSLRAKIATDVTTDLVETMESNERALLFDTPDSGTGGYYVKNARDVIFYTDLLLSYKKDLTPNWSFNTNLGWQTQSEKYTHLKSGTDGGLSQVNKFSLSASRRVKWTEEFPYEYLRQGLFATAGFDYKKYFFIEGTWRIEQVSTLAPNNNKFNYPSGNASFVYSEAFKDALPAWFDFGKIRVSAGVTGRAPEIYESNQLYKQDNNIGIVYNYIPERLGNEGIKPERKKEFEVGIENRFFKGRLGFDASYYNNRITDQIIRATVAASSGGRSMLVNAGELQNQGFELLLYGMPIKTANFNWDSRMTIGVNRNRLVRLTNGATALEHSNIDGAVRILSKPGEAIGDFYAHVPLTDGKGNKVVGSDGLYIMDRSEMVKVGNAMPKVTGGFSNTFRYKNLSLDVVIDYRIGGDVLNTPYQYMMGRGSLKESMPYRDAANGGISYYYNNDGVKIRYDAGDTGAVGKKIYDDGLILPGVDAQGNPNTKIASASTYYPSVYNWGTDGSIDYSNSIFDNSYVKMREISLKFVVPSEIARKLYCKNLSFSAFGRNLFYLYRNMPMFDPEATDATNWVGQAVIGGSTATTRTYGLAIRASF